MNGITYEKIKNIHGDNADQVAQQVCAIHGGVGLGDFQSHIGGIDISGCSEANQAKIIALMTKKDETKKDGK